jgi:predicted nucleic acid-binding protein
MFLLDTNVISELRKSGSSHANPAVQKWANNVPDTSLYLSVITILELEIGVLRVRRKDAKAGAILHDWLHQFVLPAFSGRVLPADVEIVLRCAELHVPVNRSQNDALIAATALVHRMTVITRNVADFAPTGVQIFNPWLDRS